jgi:tryptophan-rich sensory protein
MSSSTVWALEALDEDDWAGAWFVSALIVLLAWLLASLPVWFCTVPGVPPFRWHCPLPAPLQPPPWMFWVAWTVVYVTRSFAAWIVYINDPFDTAVATAGLVVYLVSLFVVEPAWVLVFVLARSPIGGALLVSAAFACAAATLGLFAAVSFGGALLAMPAVFWLAYAAGIGIGVALQQPTWHVSRCAPACTQTKPCNDCHQRRRLVLVREYIIEDNGGSSSSSSTTPIFDDDEPPMAGSFAPL